MKEIKHPSAVPIYGIAAVWVLYALIIGMYPLYHLLICAAVSAGAFFALRHFFPGTVEYVEEKVTTGDEELDELIAYGKKAVAELRGINLRIPEEDLTQKITRIEHYTEQIFKKASEDKSNIFQVRRFFDYYLPTSTDLLNKYITLRDSGVSTDSVTATKTKILGMLDTIGTAFEKELDSMYENDVVDITADIEVMKKMMAAEGLTENKDI